LEWEPDDFLDLLLELQFHGLGVHVSVTWRVAADSEDFEHVSRVDFGHFQAFVFEFLVFLDDLRGIRGGDDGKHGVLEGNHVIHFGLRLAFFHFPLQSAHLEIDGFGLFLHGHLSFQQTLLLAFEFASLLVERVLRFFEILLGVLHCLDEEEIPVLEGGEEIS
jgi:hypothetical protein